tara:strand:+ start:2090 stop:2827 length:738 start_codon:yes stop_codon:yes gene_type:complete
MKHELREFFPKVLGIYHPDGEFEHHTIKETCERIKQEIPEGHEEWSFNLFDTENLCHYYNQSNSSILDVDPVFVPFEQWLKKCAHHFMTEIHNYVLPGGPDDLFVSDCWMNWCRKERAAQVKHNHNNSLISGTYYVSREDYVHAGLDFFQTCPDLHPSLTHMKQWDNVTKYSRQTEQFYPSEGTLLLWSSELYHGYDGTVNLWDGRTTISMNFVPSVIDNGKYAYAIDTDRTRYQNQFANKDGIS